MRPRLGCFYGFRPTAAFIRFKSTQPINLTFFTKENCMLCYNAGQILDKALASDQVKDVEIKVNRIDIMKPENCDWFDEYCYDVPVLHVDRESQESPIKFMHYFFKDKLIEEFTRDPTLPRDE